MVTPSSISGITIPFLDNFFAFGLSSVDFAEEALSLAVLLCDDSVDAIDEAFCYDPLDALVAEFCDEPVDALADALDDEALSESLFTFLLISPIFEVTSSEDNFDDASDADNDALSEASFDDISEDSSETPSENPSIAAEEPSL